MRGYLSKAGSLLAPDSFMLAMEGELEFSGLLTHQCSVEVLAKRVKAYLVGMSKIEGHLKRLEGTNNNERLVIYEIIRFML